MTGPQTITAEHLRTLLDASSSSIIGLLDGEVTVLDAGDDGGAIEVISRADLLDRLGGGAEGADLESEAEALTTATQQLGG